MGFLYFLLHPDRWIASHIKRGIKHAVFGETIAEYKGERGERNVARIAERACARTTAVPIKNLCLPWPDGKTSQIDELIVADSGIYVIEVKNYKGWIFGNEKNQYWTQILYTGIRGESIKNRLYNPIRQNNSHILCIKKNLGDYKGPFHSLVVFSDEAEFKDVTVLSSNVYVLHKSSLHSVFRDINDQHKGQLGDDEVDDIKAKLIHASLKADSQHHAENVRKQISMKESQIANGFCPRCGAPLVMRTARRGANAGSQFIGCSRYPKCTYTRNLS